MYYETLINSEKNYEFFIYEGKTHGTLQKHDETLVYKEKTTILCQNSESFWSTIAVEL